MKTRIHSIVGAAIIGMSCLVAATPSSAARIIKPILGGPFDPYVNNLGTIQSIRLIKPNIYDFTFTIATGGAGQTQIQAGVLGPPAVSEPIKYTLFSGLPGFGSMVDQTSYIVGPTITDDLLPGKYYLEILPANIKVNRELLTGGLQLSVPEPASWALMMVGIGAAGAGLRSNRRRRTVAAA